MQFFHTISDSLTRPNEFFKKLKGKTLGTPFLYFAILFLFSTVMSFLMSKLLQPFAIQMLQEWFGAVDMPIAQFEFLTYTLSYGWGLAMSFVGAGVLFLWIMLFGGKVEYPKTYELAVYSKTPTLLFGWIPFLGILAGVYSLVLLIVGTHKMYPNISMQKSALMYIIPLLVIMFLGAAFVFFAIGALATTANLAGGAFFPGLYS